LPTLAALARETLVFAEPSYAAKRIGYLRAGAVVTRGARPVGYAGCPDGWYRISPEGHVCVGRAATLDADHPLVRAARRRPDRLSALPYAYARPRLPTPHFYARLPERAQWLAAEPDGALHERRVRALGWDAAWDEAVVEPVPDFLQAGRPVPVPWGVSRPADALDLGNALPGAGFAFLSFYERDGRRFGITTDFTVVPLDRVTPVAPSSFQGVALGNGLKLPIAFVMSRAAHLYRLGAGGGLERERSLSYREAVGLSGKRRKIGELTFLETADGKYLRDGELVKIEPLSELPKAAQGRRTWIDVSIVKQALVAYQGSEPVYATLVSTGAGGLGEPESTHATVRGEFLVHTKHVTATMDSDEAGDEYDMRDVPYVQYFEKGYALHAAYWHDGFGAPRSHGCINLAPVDARWLFHFTDPPVPEKWHGASALSSGTLIRVRP
jgi:hypothetical protein